MNATGTQQGALLSRARRLLADHRRRAKEELWNPDSF
jgi:hypothetical protein